MMACSCYPSRGFAPTWLLLNGFTCNPNEIGLLGQPACDLYEQHAVNAHLSKFGKALTTQELQGNLGTNTGSAYLPWSSGVAREEVSLLLADGSINTATLGADIICCRNKGQASFPKLPNAFQ